MVRPLVTVVCLCYNQKRFVREALESVFSQTYSEIQVIVVDDASTDGSQQEILGVLSTHPDVPLLLLENNVGSCKAFNRALSLAKGEFVIDLAADDVLLPTRIAEGVQSFLEKGTAMGVHFSDAQLIDESGSRLSLHSDRFPHQSVPQGSVYSDVIRRYFICPPTIMYRTRVLDVLGGYDESLQYEDFDMLVRAARQWEFYYSPRALVNRRIVTNSLATRQFETRSTHQESTYRICLKILSINQTRAEQAALAERLRYELRLNLRLLNLKLCWKYFLLWAKNRTLSYDR